MQWKCTRNYGRKNPTYLRFLETKSAQGRVEYNRKCASAKKGNRKIHRESWFKYICNIDHNIHGEQNIAFKIMEHLNKTERNTNILNNKHPEGCLNYYKNYEWSRIMKKVMYSTQKTRLTLTPLNTKDLMKYWILLNTANRQAAMAST